MLLFLLPFVLVAGVLAVSSRERSRTAPALSSVGMLQPQGVAPSPLQVMNQFLAAGKQPPAFVVQCASAEAELAGNIPLARQITRQLGAPISAPAVPRRRSNSTTRLQQGGGYENAAIPYDGQPSPSGREDLANDQAFTETPRYANGPAPGLQRADVPYDGHDGHDGQQQPQAQPLGSGFPPFDVDAYARDLAGAHEQVHKQYQQNENVTPYAFDEQLRQTRFDEIDLPAPPLPSPVPGVDGAAYVELQRRLARAEPTFASKQHVGQYRQRRARLAELGLDADAIAGNPAAQDDALAREVADTVQRFHEAGDLDEHVGKPIDVPGYDGYTQVTLSGMVGLANAAGLDGAISWLGSRRDRKKYPHTTEVFLATNGVF